VREYPRDACGLIAGFKRNGISYVRRVYPLRNIAKSPFMYEADAEELYNAFMSIDRDGLDFLDIYHSHLTAILLVEQNRLNWIEDALSIQMRYT